MSASSARGARPSKRCKSSRLDVVGREDVKTAQSTQQRVLGRSPSDPVEALEDGRCRGVIDAREPVQVESTHVTDIHHAAIYFYSIF